MLNRSKHNLPAIYVDALAFGSLQYRPSPQPVFLEIFDVTYLHYHSTLELGYCTGGSGVCYVEDKEYPFSEGDVQIIFPFQRHLSKSTGAGSSQWYWLSVDPFALLTEGGFTDIQRADEWFHREMGLCGILKEAQYPEIARLIKRLVAESWEDSHTSLHHTELCCAYVYTLLLEIARASQGLAKLSIRGDKNLVLLAPALNCINSAVVLGESPPVPRLAEACSMSLANFRRVFKKVVGLSPKEYISNCLIRKAERLLLTTDKSILSISEEAGFQNVSGFNRQFFTKNGLPPSEFRKKYRAEVTPLHSESGPQAAELGEPFLH